MGKCCLRGVQGLLRVTSFGDIHQRADDLVVPRLEPYSMGTDVEMPRSPCRGKPAKLIVVFRLAPSDPLEFMLHDRQIVLMYPLQEHIDRWHSGGSGCHHSAAFLRPEDVTGGELPTESTGAAEPLCLVEIGLDVPALGVLGAQRLDQTRLLLERAQQLIARLPERLLIASLRGAERDHEDRGDAEQNDTGNVAGGDSQGIGIDK